MFQIIFVSARPDIIRLLGSRLQECPELGPFLEARRTSRNDACDVRLKGSPHLKRTPRQRSGSGGVSGRLQHGPAHREVAQAASSRGCGEGTPAVSRFPLSLRGFTLDGLLKTLEIVSRTSTARCP